MELDHQLHILSQCVRGIAACGYYHILFEQAEGPGDNEVSVKAVQQDAGGQKRAFILQDLHSSQRVQRQTLPSAFRADALGGADQPPDRHHIAVLHHRLDDPLQRVRLER